MASENVMHADGHGAGAHADYLDSTKGLWSWLTTVDHKRIGLMYLWSVEIGRAHV